MGSGVKRGPERRRLLACPRPVCSSAPASPPGTPPTTRSVARVAHPVRRPAAVSGVSLPPDLPATSPESGSEGSGWPSSLSPPERAFASGAGHDCPGLVTAQRGASGASRRLHRMAVRGSSMGAGPGPVCLAGRRSSTALDPVPGRQAPLPALRTLGLPHLLPRSPSSTRSLAL